MARRIKHTAADALDVLKVEDPSAGIDLRRSPTLIAANRARVCRNWALDEPGALKTYPGWESWLTSSLGSGRGQGGRRIYLAAVAAFTLFAWSGNVYMPSDGGVPGGTVLTGLSTSTEIDFPYDADLVAVVDGASQPQKSTDGSAWTQMGISAPSVAPVASAIAGGSLIDANTYELSYSYVDAGDLGAESNESATDTQAASGADLTVRLAVTASADTQVDGIYVYIRNVTAGESVRRRYRDTPYANTTGNIDIDGSETWEDNDEAPTDHDLPPTLEYAVPWKSRWWGFKGRTLYFSQIFEPQSWPALFFIDIPFEKGDAITAIIPQGDTLVVFGAESKPYLIIGQTSLDFEVRPAFGAQAGALGFRSVTAIENGIIHAATDGVYIFDGATDRLLSDDIDPGWQDCMSLSAVADLNKVAVLYDTPRKTVHIAVPRLFPFGTAGEWILDLHRTRVSGESAWTSTDRTIGGYVPWDGPETGAGNHGRLFSWSNTIGKLYEECTGTTADGGDMIADYTGPTFATGGPYAIFTQFFGEYRPAAGTFAVEVLVDGQSTGSQTIDIDDPLSVYGVAEYGEDSYGGPDRRSFPIMLPMEAEGLTVLTKAQYTGRESFAFYTYQIGVSAEAVPSGV